MARSEERSSLRKRGLARRGARMSELRPSRAPAPRPLARRGCRFDL